MSAPQLPAPPKSKKVFTEFTLWVDIISGVMGSQITCYVKGKSIIFVTLVTYFTNKNMKHNL